MNKPQTFTIETRGAGQGGVGLSVVGPTEPKIGCVDNHDGTLTVEYLPNSVGSYEIAVAFADQPVPGRWSLLLVQCSVLLVTFTLTAIIHTSSICWIRDTFQHVHCQSVGSSPTRLMQCGLLLCLSWLKQGFYCHSVTSVFRCFGGATVTALDFRPSDRGFNSLRSTQPSIPQVPAFTGWC